MALKKVIVVGAGPSGLLLALLLSKQGINVQVLEAAETLDAQPRATHYAPPAVYELGRAGVLDEIRAAGFTPDVVCWRKLDGTLLGALDGSVFPPEYPYQVACLPLDRLGKILERHLEKQPTAEILYGHRVVKLEQDNKKATVFVERIDRKATEFSADFIVGCDGANSQIRRCLFGDWEFPGKTWEQQIVATNVYYDFKKFGWHDANFIVDPEHWFMAARITNDGMWRVTYGETAGLTKEQYIERQPAKYKAMLPGHPEPSEYRLTNLSPYKIHQRLAEKLRVGRFLLAADAAHLCNPFGGMGLTGGIVDVGGLYDCLMGIAIGSADLDILDLYDSVRREKYSKIVNPISSENFRRLWDQNPDTAAESDPFLLMCQKAAKDKKYSLELQMGVNALKYDFTQHYSKATTESALGIDKAVNLQKNDGDMIST